MSYFDENAIGGADGSDDENKKVKPIHVIERQFLKQPEKTQSTTKECPPGKVLNVVTNRCKKAK